MRFLYSTVLDVHSRPEADDSNILRCTGCMSPRKLFRLAETVNYGAFLYCPGSLQLVYILVSCVSFLALENQEKSLPTGGLLPYTML